MQTSIDPTARKGLRRDIQRRNSPLSSTRYERQRRTPLQATPSIIRIFISRGNALTNRGNRERERERSRKKGRERNINKKNKKNKIVSRAKQSARFEFVAFRLPAEFPRESSSRPVVHPSTIHTFACLSDKTSPPLSSLFQPSPSERTRERDRQTDRQKKREERRGERDR